MLNKDQIPFINYFSKWKKTILQRRFTFNSYLHCVEMGGFGTGIQPSLGVLAPSAAKDSISVTRPTLRR